MKEVYRKVMLLERHSLSVATVTNEDQVQQVVLPAAPVEPKAIVWKLPKEPTVKDVNPNVDTSVNPPKPSSLKANILSNGF
jgi:hypothetical protein